MRPSLDQIVSAASFNVGVPEEEICTAGLGQANKVSTARQVVCVIADECGYKREEVGRKLGYSKHSAVYAAIRKGRDLIATDTYFKHLYDITYKQSGGITIEQTIAKLDGLIRSTEVQLEALKEARERIVKS